MSAVYLSWVSNQLRWRRRCAVTLPLSIELITVCDCDQQLVECHSVSCICDREIRKNHRGSGRKVTTWMIVNYFCRLLGMKLREEIE